MPTYEEMLLRIKSVDEPRDRFLLALSYATGGRVSEVIQARKIDFELIETEKGKVLLITLPNRKVKATERGRDKTKIIPLFVDKEFELSKLIAGYINDHITDLFGFKTPRRARQIIQKHLKYNPHFIRHIRTTHESKYFGYNVEKLMIVRGWKTAEMAQRYKHLSWRDVFGI